MVPRKILGNFCVINDLSYPKGGSVNDSILKDEFSFKGVTVDKAIYFTNAFFFSKIDIENALRLIPVAPLHWNLLDNFLENRLHIDTRLTMDG